MIRTAPAPEWRDAVLWILLLLLAPPTTANSGGTPTMRCETIENSAATDTRGLGATFDAWADAVAASDPASLGDLITDDAEFWSHGQEPLVGREAVLNAFRSLFEAYEMRQEFHCRELILTDDWAFVRGTEHNRLRPRAGGEPAEVRQRAFSLLRRGEDDTWRFARGMTNLEARPSPQTD